MWGWNETAVFSMFAGIALKSTAALGMAWLAAFLLRGRSAAARHMVWTAAAAAMLALPFLSVSLPTMPVSTVSALPGSSVFFQTTSTGRSDTVVSHSAVRASAAGQSRHAPWRPDWRFGVMLLWAA